MSKDRNPVGKGVPSPIEWGMIAALVAVVIVAGINALGPVVARLWDKAF